ncbi:PREDICTED: uncharacterized protein LOC108787640 [Nanorana parkeri]|uniref:uncharacterized protein LOC108787640 n=1 Tax=Nanorana parkeri TaxID=125878 RepID=UPI000854F6EC|nr:PREDICTED: uncharacterized protein LOC108787640 [Nanorana parkeri]
MAPADTTPGPFALRADLRRAAARLRDLADISLVPDVSLEQAFGQTRLQAALNNMKMKAFFCLVVISLCLARSVHANICSPVITDDHLKYLDVMIDAQLNTSCSVQVELIDDKKFRNTNKYCYKRAVIAQLADLLEKLEFKPNSQSYNHTKILTNLYNQRVKNCIGDVYFDKEDISQCSSHNDLSPAQILERVKTSFMIFRDFKEEPSENCYLEYASCEEDYHYVKKGSQCACPSPIPPIVSSSATQKSLINPSEIKSSPSASIIPFSTVPLTDYISVTDTQNPQQSSESIEMSSIILTSIPTEVQHLTTIMDHLHAATTDRPVSGPESPHTKMDITFSDMEFTKGITESTYAMGFSQTRTYPELSNIEGLNTDGSHIETFSTTTTDLNKDYSQLTRELTSITEPAVDELLGTTEHSIVSQSLESNFQKYSEASMEPGIEPSLSSTVTKMRRSLENVDKTLSVYASTHAQPVLSSDGSATKPHYLTSSIPPTFNSLQTISQESDIRNLGWAASYLLPTILTTKHTSSEAEMSSPVSEVQSLPSEASLHPKLTGLEGGYTHDNKHQEQNVAAFLSEDRENKGAGPIHGFNRLPILETEQHQDGRQNSNLFLVIIPSILAILFLCGLLFFMYRYRLLRRQLNREVSELPELSFFSTAAYVSILKEEHFGAVGQIRRLFGHCPTVLSDMKRRNANFLRNVERRHPASISGQWLVRRAVEENCSGAVLLFFCGLTSTVAAVCCPPPQRKRRKEEKIKGCLLHSQPLPLRRKGSQTRKLLAPLWRTMTGKRSGSSRDDLPVRWKISEDKRRTAIARASPGPSRIPVPPRRPLPDPPSVTPTFPETYPDLKMV